MVVATDVVEVGADQLYYVAACTQHIPFDRCESLHKDHYRTEYTVGLDNENSILVDMTSFVF